MNTVTEKDEHGRSRSGFYAHKETGVIVELTNDADLGSPLTNAFIKAGYVYAGETRGEAEESLKTLNPNLAPKAPKTAAELRKELEEAEARERAERPLSKMNKAELVATAEAEGVELPKEEPTNKALADLIQAKRDEGNKE